MQQRFRVWKVLVTSFLLIAASSCSPGAEGKSASCTGAGGSAHVSCGYGCTSTFGGGSCSIN